MDAYDEDSGARPGPDGSAGTRLPETPPARVDSLTDAAAAGGADSGGADDGVGDSGGGDFGSADRAPRSKPTAGPATPTALTIPVPSPEPGAPRPPGVPRTGVAALSPRYQVVAALALAVVGVAACVHLLMVFLSLAPANTVTKQHGKAVEEWVYPEFEQNWKLFAPNPLQQNIAVQVRAVVRAKDGGLRTTGWTDLSAQDGAAIDGNLVPSHTQQNELRRAWDFFTATHSTDNRSLGMRGSLSEQYLRRIVVMRLYRTYPADQEGVIQRVQIRSSTTNVQPPEWSRERVPDKPVYRVLPWWTVTAGEAAGGVR
ncbi:DUF5819 family protein [Streptomyces roseochromogenus]|uniref:Uncharacterized protein n=1 Tax=Streptomyces roseochromogenus subsp. oscitans DS 12.976 TaxID=1352936 RepID=V6KJD8_STRRC|nr:DUF5819 family protein [Streptomyces roseochromogenus]EST29109.1 hypothetical protein M878_21250 [Streptomyces roseochromogenus subsp. oscitans DS 12.976]